MQSIAALTPAEMEAFLLHTAVSRPVFIWGPPGIGKSSLVEKFADSVGLECVSLLGSQLAPEDLIGVPQIVDGCSRFCPPRMIARDEPYCLFLDELNACSHEVQKAFYSLIHERRLAEYHLPEGSIVIGAGNRSSDSAIVKTMSSALINRMVHVQLRASHRDWLEWAQGVDAHPLVLDYIRTRPDHLWVQPPKHEEPFSTPRSWHMLSDLLRELGAELDEQGVFAAAAGCISPAHATQFKAFYKQLHGKYRLDAVLSGETAWPRDAKDRDVLYFLAQSLRGKLLKELPDRAEKAGAKQRELAYRVKARMKELASISLEIAQTVLVGAEGEELPAWFLMEVYRDLPRLAAKSEAKVA